MSENNTSKNKTTVTQVEEKKYTNDQYISDLYKSLLKAYEALTILNEKVEKQRKGSIQQTKEIQERKKDINRIKDSFDKKSKEQVEDFEKQKSEIKDIKDELKEQRNRIPEIIGLFSAIIAIVLIDVSIIKSASTFLSAMLLISALTCSITIFAFLIHFFFSIEGNENRKLKSSFWIPIIILVVLIISATCFYWKGKDLYQHRNEEPKLNGNLKLDCTID